MISLFIIYFMITGIIAGNYAAATQNDSDKAVFYFTICFLTGWITFPIKFVKGFRKTYVNVEKEKMQLND